MAADVGAFEWVAFFTALGGAGATYLGISQAKSNERVMNQAVQPLKDVTAAVAETNKSVLSQFDNFFAVMGDLIRQAKETSESTNRLVTTQLDNYNKLVKDLMKQGKSRDT